MGKRVNGFASNDVGPHLGSIQLQHDPDNEDLSDIEVDLEGELKLGTDPIKNLEFDQAFQDSL